MYVRINVNKSTNAVENEHSGSGIVFRRYKIGTHLLDEVLNNHVRLT